MWIPLIAGFCAGVFSLAFVEAVAVFFLIQRLHHRRRPRTNRSPSDLASVSFHAPGISFQGQLWIATLPSSLTKQDIIKHLAQNEKLAKDQKKKSISSNVFDLHPSQRFARIENNMLYLVSEHGTEECINLKGCNIRAVSGGKEISRKWAKKYPIQIESVDQKVLLGSSLCLLYFDTGWEKETWCQVLRAASRWTGEKEEHLIACNREFINYSSNLEKAYPAFSKINPRQSKNLEDETSKMENSDSVGSLSMKQRIWKRITKKGAFHKEGSGSGDLKIRLLESKSTRKGSDKQPELGSQSSMESSSSHSTMGSSGGDHRFGKKETYDSSDSSKSLKQVVFDESDMTILNQQGPMCLNILCSRLFYDAHRSKDFQAACHRLIQRQLMKVGTSGYVGKINCVDLDLGMLPPYFHSFHSISRDSSFVWSFDSTIEYSGGASITIEAYINAHEFISQENIGSQNQEPSLLGDDVLEAAAEHIQKDDVSTDANNVDGNNTASQPTKGSWRSVFARIADQVSSVPITLSLRLMSLKGTVRLRIKPPPTDHIWFGFTAMPVIDLRPEASIGDHKTTSRPIEAFIVNKIKTLIQEICVLPNSEGIRIPWMISEIDDWIPRSDMPAPYNLSSLHSMTRNDTTALEHVSSGNYTVPISDADALSRIPSAEVLNAQVPEMSQSSSEFETGCSNEGNESTSSIKIQSEDATVYDKGIRSSKREKVLNFGKKVTGKLEVKGRMMVEKVREKYEHSGRGEELKETDENEVAS